MFGGFQNFAIPLDTTTRHQTQQVHPPRSLRIDIDDVELSFDSPTPLRAISQDDTYNPHTRFIPPSRVSSAQTLSMPNRDESTDEKSSSESESDIEFGLFSDMEDIHSELRYTRSIRTRKSGRRIRFPRKTTRFMHERCEGEYDIVRRYSGVDLVMYSGTSSQGETWEKSIFCFKCERRERDEVCRGMMALLKKGLVIKLERIQVKQKRIVYLELVDRWLSGMMYGRNVEFNPEHCPIATIHDFMELLAMQELPRLGLATNARHHFKFAFHRKFGSLHTAMQTLTESREQLLSEDPIVTDIGLVIEVAHDLSRLNECSNRAAIAHLFDGNISCRVSEDCYPENRRVDDKFIEDNVEEGCRDYTGRYQDAVIVGVLPVNEEGVYLYCRGKNRKLCQLCDSRRYQLDVGHRVGERVVVCVHEHVGGSVSYGMRSGNSYVMDRLTNQQLFDSDCRMGIDF